MKTRDTHRGQARHDTIKSHLIDEERHDPYKAKSKLADPTVCRTCMAVFMRGRWQWSDGRHEGAAWGLCPACQRTADNYPAGELTLKGAFLAAHRQEIVGLARNTEEEEKREHPLQRIMSVDESGGMIVIRTTDIHLPRRIGHALVAAYKGELETHYDEAGYFVRMSWTREA
jgi:hypothetical protein